MGGKKASEPIALFQTWYKEAMESGEELPEAMHLATVETDEVNYWPDVRVVLFKGLLNDDMLFFTNYNSAKADQIAAHPFVSGSFHWKKTARQIRFSGSARKTSVEISKKYFHSRPFNSQVSGLVSKQSQTAANYDDIKKIFEDAVKQYAGQEVPYPENWGGYEIKISRIEFWTNDPNRFHARKVFTLEENGQWSMQVLWP